MRPLGRSLGFGLSLTAALLMATNLPAMAQGISNIFAPRW